MKTKILISILFISVFFNAAFAQRQSDTTFYKPIIPGEKQELLKNVDMIMNMQTGLRNDFQDGEYLGTKFKFEQFRLEIKGYVHEKVFFRFRHRYTSDFEPQSLDKIIKGVDFAYLRFDLSEKWQFTVGKTYADWGGFEFDLNPIDIYEYSDIIEMADNFLTGIEIHYNATKNHSFGFQVLNTRTSTFEDIYDTVPNISASKAPLAAVLNWRGSFWGGKFSTIWSYSIFSEAKNMFKNYIALGNQLKLNKVTIMYDYKISSEDLDRTGIISNEVPDNVYNYALKNTLYSSHWLRFDYRFTPKWQLSLVGIYDQAKWMSDMDPAKNTDDWRTTYTFIPTVEYFPWDNLNLKVYLGYVGRSFNYSEYATSVAGLKSYNTGRIIVGIISPLQVF